MAIGKTFIQILGPHEQFPNNPGYPTIFLQKQFDTDKTVFGFSDGLGNTFSSFLVIEKGTSAGNKLSKIFDVNITSPLDGDSLVFSSGSSKWVNQVSSGSGSSNSQSEISALNIDWNYTHLYKTLSADTTFTFSNTGDAKTIIIAITNTTDDWTVTWPSVDWGSGGAPVQRTGAVTDIYTFAQINGAIYGSVRQ